VPDPRQQGQAVGQRLGEGEPAAQPDALVEPLLGVGELAALVGHLGHPHQGDARGGQRWLA
jgi:hypothetical protein